MTTTTKHSVSEERVVLPVDLRDYFAAKAMTVFLANTESSFASDAKNAYEIADAMLAERAKERT